MCSRHRRAQSFPRNCTTREPEFQGRTRLVEAYRDAGLSTLSDSEKGCFLLRPYTELLLAYTKRGMGSRDCDI